MGAHASLTSADLHECKGASTAVVGKTIIADGAGAATFKYANPRGSVYYSSVGAGTALVTPTVYTKFAPTTTASTIATEFTEATTARLTYTGTDTLDCRVIANVGFSQTIAADRDVTVAIYKNGVIIAGAENIATVGSAQKVHHTIIYDIPSLATNDYIEIYGKISGTGDITILSLYLTAFCMRG